MFCLHRRSTESCKRVTFISYSLIAYQWETLSTAVGTLRQNRKNSFPIVGVPISPCPIWALILHYLQNSITMIIEPTSFYENEYITSGDIHQSLIKSMHVLHLIDFSTHTYKVSLRKLEWKLKWITDEQTCV